jgi:hypothetical protein
LNGSGTIMCLVYVRMIASFEGPLMRSKGTTILVDGQWLLRLFQMNAHRWAVS